MSKEPTNYDELKKILETMEEPTPEDFMFEGVPDYSEEDYPSLKINGFEQVKHHGGEGQGDGFFTVYSFELTNEETICVSFGGWYASYNGAEYEEMYHVEPVEVTRTEYQAVK